MPFAWQLRCLILLSAIGSSGCRVHQLVAEQSDVRQLLKSYYRDQVIDNLIAARRHEAVLQVSYTDLKGTIDQRATANIQDTYTSATGATGSHSNAWVPSFNAYQDSQFIIDAAPITNADDIYKEYDNRAKDLTFLREGEKPKFEDDPTSTPEHKKPQRKIRFLMERTVGGIDYWILEKDAPKFYDLYQKTTVLRQKPMPTPFVTKIASFTKAPYEEDGAVKVWLRLEDAVPMQPGTATIILNGVETNVHYEPDRSGATTQPAAGQKTDVIELTIDDQKLGDGKTIAGLIGTIIKPEGFFVSFPSPAAVPQPDIQKLNSTLEDLRLQFRQ